MMGVIPQFHDHIMDATYKRWLIRDWNSFDMQLLKFVGCYHGHGDSFLVQAGSGVATLGLPDSPGVPAASTGASHSRHLLTCR